MQDKKRILLILAMVLLVCCLLLTLVACGEKGKDGNDGINGRNGVDGKNGNDGLTPYIGANGNWFIGENDTNVKANIEQSPNENFEYYLNISKTGYIVRGIGTISGADIEIPATYNGLPVVGIADKAFENCTWLQSVIIGDNVENIGYDAFYPCENIRSVTIGKSVKSIGGIENRAFSYCPRLIEVYNKSSLNITAGSTDNGYVAYYAKNVYTQEGGSKLKIDKNGFIIFDDTLLIDYIGNSTDIIIPNGITTITRGALLRCREKESITIPASAKAIEANALYSQYYYYSAHIIFEDNNNWYVTDSIDNWQNKVGGSAVNPIYKEWGKSIESVAFYNYKYLYKN